MFSCLKLSPMSRKRPQWHPNLVCYKVTALSKTALHNEEPSLDPLLINFVCGGMRLIFSKSSFSYQLCIAFFNH